MQNFSLNILIKMKQFKVELFLSSKTETKKHSTFLEKIMNFESNYKLRKFLIYSKPYIPFFQIVCFGPILSLSSFPSSGFTKLEPKQILSWTIWTSNTLKMSMKYKHK